jgi:hypothetical protein
MKFIAASLPWEGFYAGIGMKKKHCSEEAMEESGEMPISALKTTCWVRRSGKKCAQWACLSARRRVSATDFVTAKKPHIQYCRNRGSC